MSSSTRTYEYYRAIFKGKSFPLAFVDMDLLDENIALSLIRSSSKSIRIASKSIRSAEIMRYIFDKNPRFQGIMAFHGNEACDLAETGFDDILLGYPIVDELLIERIARLVKAGKHICLMVDDAQQVAIANAIGKRLQIQLPICIDIDLSVDFGPLHFGVWRSPIVDIEAMERLLKGIKGMDWVRIDGAMGYEAQIAGVGDKLRFDKAKSLAIRQLKKRSIPKIRAWRSTAIKMLKADGHKLRFVNGGGTGSLESTTQEKDVTEVTVGSGFFNPHLFDNYQVFQYKPAAAYAIQIVRTPKAGVYTCHMGGYIASGAVDAYKAPMIHLPEGAKFDENEGAGEVQTPIFYKGNIDLQLGDPIFLRHSKAGELCERFKQLYLVRDGRVEKEVSTFRGDGKCYG